MSPATIPGFYYDESKGKYFKIQPHHAAPAGVKYTREAMQRQARNRQGLHNPLVQDVFKRLHNFETPLEIAIVSSTWSPFLINADHAIHTQSTGIQGSKIFNAGALESFSLKRELNPQSIQQQTDAKHVVWAESLKKESNPLLPRWIIEKGVDRFVLDEVTGSVLYVPRAGLNQVHFSIGEEYSSGRQLFDAVTDAIVSLTLSPSRVLLTTCMGPHSGSLSITKLFDPNQLDRILSVDNLARRLSPREYYVRREQEMRNLLPTQPCQRMFIANTTFRDAAPKPHPGSSEFAIAAGETVMRVYLREGTDFDWELQHEPLSADGYSYTSDALAVDWLTQNVVISGHRDGRVILWDTRSSGRQSQGSPIRHPSCISHVRKLNENQLVVAGLKDKMCSYDLRYVTHSTVARQPRRGLFSTSPPPTNPYLAYHAYLNEAQPGNTLGLDVSQTHNLIAVANARPQKNLIIQPRCMTEAAAVKLVDASTGQVLRARGVEKAKKTHTPGSEDESETSDTDKMETISDNEAGFRDLYGELGGSGVGERKMTLVSCLKFTEGDLGDLRLFFGSNMGLGEWVV